MMDATNLEEEIMVVTRMQAKKALYLDPRTEKERLEEARIALEEEQYHEETTSTLTCLASGSNLIK